MFIFGDSTLDFRRRELVCSGAPVYVEPQVFDLLEYLVRHRDRVVTKEDLLADIWRGRAISDSTIAVRINAARRAIGDTGEEQRFIRTLRRKGFRFVAEVTEEADALKSPAPGAASDSRTSELLRVRQQLSFCRTSDDVQIAIAVAGRGPLLVRAATWLSHAEHELHSPLRLPLLRFLSSRFRLIRYDGRGSGLSDRHVSDISFEGFLKDLDAVVESLGLQRYALMGVSQGAPIAIAHAVRYPERVTKLILHGAYAQGRAKRQTAAEQETTQALLALMRRGWGEEGSAFMRAFSSLYIPNATNEQVKGFAELQRAATSADNAVRLRTACDQIDVLHLLQHVRTPTLVMHARGDAVVPFEEGRRIAASIRRARFVPLDSDNHILIDSDPAWPTYVREINAFLSEG